ncbi:hypothetical protein [Jeotgalibaca porci]|uniref:hypothetical protein n=1 Tax=Jeotgalibaca porci TaxID=1868793 RepID=UPI00359FB9E4
MKGILTEISNMVKEFGSAPRFEEMPYRTLQDKGIAGPTSAHVIEEVHTPLNLAYITFTTGSSAFQNIVGVTYEEIPGRIKTSFSILDRIGLKSGDEVLITYPPLVNVFPGEALRKFGLKWSFLVRSSRDAFLAALYERKPKAVIGESSFIRAALEDAKNMGVMNELPKNLILLTAGTPLDLDLLPIAQNVLRATVHDLYGCQEFGWLTLDGIPLREDIQLLRGSVKGKPNLYELVVGGLPMGDSFPITESGHVCNMEGKIITYRRERSYPEYEVIVKATMLSSSVTLARLARTILRIKGRVVKISPDVIMNAPYTVLELKPDCYTCGNQQGFIIEGPVKTALFDDLARAQLDYQKNGKADPVWEKRN